MFSMLKLRKRRERHKQQVINQGWNECLSSILELVQKHQWAVDEDEPQEIFCDGCGLSLVMELKGMRR